MTKKIGLCVIIIFSNLLYGVCLLEDKTLFGGRLIIENQVNNDTESVTQGIRDHLYDKRGWWHIIIKSNVKLDLCQLLTSSWMQQAMANWLFGFRVSTLDLSQCDLIVPNKAIQLPGSNQLNLTLPFHFQHNKAFHKAIAAIKRQNVTLGHRGTRIQRIKESYSQQPHNWTPTCIN